MALRIGDVAPDFECESTHGTIKFHEWIGKDWVALFSHPADFTPVCTTELGGISKLEPQFRQRGVKLIGLSVDTVEHHNEWLKDVNEVNATKVEYPLLADTNRVVSKLYGMLDVNAPSAAAGMPLTVRSFFIIDSNKKVRFIATYPASCGRNFYEFLRVIDSLKLTDSKKVATPQNWKPKEDAIVVPSISDEEATKLFGGFRKIKPYMRYVTEEQYTK